MYVWGVLNMIPQTPKNTLFGFVGGVGPHASTKFLKTIYCIRESYLSEQDLPRILLLSDPSVPNRTELLLSGKKIFLYTIIKDSIEKINAFGADKVAILCFTLHYFMPQLTKEYKNILSLVDIALKEVLITKKMHLLLGTLATYQLNIFEKSPYWDMAKNFIILPAHEDQSSIYDLIHQIKVGRMPDRTLYETLKKLLFKYKAEYLLAGCTEFHLLSDEAALKSYNLNIIDPLNVLAWEVAHSKNWSF